MAEAEARNGFKSEGAHLFRRKAPEIFFKKCPPPLLGCAPRRVGTLGHEGGTDGHSIMRLGGSATH